MIFLTLAILFAVRICKYGYLFAIQFSLAAAAVLAGGFWFLTGAEILPENCCVWNVLERGSLTAIESISGVIGISNVLFGWAFSDRDKLTLGISQSDLIRDRYGKGYITSVIIHFSITVLCMLFAKVGAREGAFLSFAALLWGCVPQAIICSRIAMNRQRREQAALALWEKRPDSQEVLTEMGIYLAAPDVYNNRFYFEVLCGKTAYWLMDCQTLKEMPTACCGTVEKDIETISSILYILTDKAPEAERMHFGEELLRTTALKLAESCPDENRRYAGAEMLACGYFRFLLGEDSILASSMEEKTDALAVQIDKVNYYSQGQDPLSDYMGSYLRSLLSGLEWYLFLEREAAVPRHIAAPLERPAFICNGFHALVFSIFGQKNRNDMDTCYVDIAWEQVCEKEVVQHAGTNSDIS